MNNAVISLIIIFLAAASLITTFVAPPNVALIVLAITVILIAIAHLGQQKQLQSLLSSQAQEIAHLQALLNNLSTTSPLATSLSTTTVAERQGEKSPEMASLVATNKNEVNKAESRRNYRTYMGLSLTEDQPVAKSSEEKLYLGVASTAATETANETANKGLYEAVVELTAAVEAQQPERSTALPETFAANVEENLLISEAAIAEKAIVLPTPSLAVESFVHPAVASTKSLETSPLPSGVNYEQMLNLPPAPHSGITAELTLPPDITQSFLASEILNLQQMQQLPPQFQISAAENSAPDRTLGFSSPLTSAEPETAPPLTVEMPQPQSLTRQRRRYSTFAGLSFESPSGRLTTSKIDAGEKVQPVNTRQDTTEIVTGSKNKSALTKERRRYSTFAGLISLDSGNNLPAHNPSILKNRKPTAETPSQTTDNLPHDQVSNLAFNGYTTGKTNAETGEIPNPIAKAVKSRRRYQTFMGLSLSETPQAIDHLPNFASSTAGNNNLPLAQLINNHCSTCNKEQNFPPDPTVTTSPGFCWYCGARFGDF
jgi:hypothetical protein